MKTATTLATASLLLLSVNNFAKAESFPVLGDPVDSKTYKLGTGTCSTERTGTWIVNEGVVVQVKKPNDCMFKDGMLILIVGEEKLPLIAVDNSFIIKKFGNSKAEYRWLNSSGKLLFKTNSDKPINASDIKGILEPTCSDNNCLN